MKNEIELKLQISERDVWRLLRLPMLNAVTLKKFPSQQLNNTYYDTADFRLCKRGIAVRLRQIGRTWLQTVKTEGRVIAGLHERPEWEIETREGTIDFSRLPDAQLKSLLEKTLDGASLQVVFGTDFTRLIRVLQLNNGTQCEFCLDRGKISAVSAQVNICEVELEIIAGDPLALFDFVRALLEQVPLTLARDSKAARGFALALGATPRPVKAQKIALDKHMTVEQGFVAIAAACMDNLSANAAGCIAGEDAEYLHQMRVAIRRLRTAIHLFSDHLDAEKMIAIVDELRWLSGQLGMTRDLDVFLSETLLPTLAAWPKHQGLQRIRDSITARRNAAMAASRAALQSARYQRLLLDLGARLVAISGEAGGPSGADESITLLEFARVALKQHRKQLIRRANHLLELTPEERHRVRISGKRLRYAAGFFLPLFSTKRSEPYVRALANLQTSLGALNDAATTKTILSQLADEESNESAAIVQAWALGVSHGELTHLPQAYEQFVQQQTFW